MKNNHLVAFIALTSSLSLNAQFKQTSHQIQEVEYGLNIVVVDWNKDGLLDVIEGGYAGEKAKLDIQQKDGKYKTVLTFPVDNEIQDLLAADFDKDGHADVLIGGFQPTIFFGNGKDGFKRKHVLHTNYSYNFQYGDFNQDGHNDLACIGSGEGNTGVCIYAGDGKMGFNELKTDSPQGLTQIVSADFTNDGNPEIIAVADEKIYCISFNPTNRSFKAETVIAGTGLVFAGDVTNDRLPDILVMNATERTYAIYKNDKGLKFSLLTNINAIDYPQACFVLDVNQDKNNDILFVGYSGEIRFALQKSEKEFTLTPVLANIQNYLKDIDLVSFDGAKLQLAHAGLDAYGLHDVFIPKAISWTSKYDGEPFAVLEGEAFDKIIAYFKPIYNLQSQETDILVYAAEVAPENGKMAAYIAHVEDYIYKFDAKGNVLRREDKPHNIYRLPADDYDNISQNVGKDGIREEIGVGSSSYSDGLETGNWETKLQRSPEKDNAYDIIKNADARAKITQYIGARYTEEVYKKADVFLESYYHTLFQKETIYYYGIFVQGKLYYFNMEGAFEERL